jgi:hypothetical protein
MEETRVPRENHRSVAAHWQTLSHTVVSSTSLACAGFELTTVVVMDTDSTGSCIYIYIYIHTNIWSRPWRPLDWLIHWLVLNANLSPFDLLNRIGGVMVSVLVLKDWFARNQDNVSKWGDMSIRGPLCQWVSTIYIHISVLA